MNPIDEGALAHRLAQMNVPGAAGAAARAIEAFREAPEARRRWNRTLMVTLAAAVLIGVVALPPIAQAAGGIAVQLLEAAGIAPGDAGRVARDGSVSATSGGYTVKLIGAYGDQFHTALFLTTENQKVGVGAMPILTDESGRQIKPDSTHGWGVLQFQGLTPGRHQLTLHIERLDELPVRPGSGMVHGDWTLRFPLDVTAAQTADAAPQAGQLGTVHVAVNQAGGSGEMLYLQLETTGATMDELLKEPREGQPIPSPAPTDTFQIRVLDVHGHALSAVQATAGVAGKTPEGSGDVLWNNYYMGVGPGTYRVLVTYEGHQFESQFTIH